MAAPEPYVPASPSTAGMTSDEAIDLRQAMKEAEARILTVVGGYHSAAAEANRVARDDIATLATHQHGLSNSLLAIFRQVQINELQRAEATKRAELRAVMVDERLSFLVRASQRDHDTLSDVQALVPEADIVPWFRRAWRPVLVLSALALLAGGIGGCGAVAMFGSTPDAVDASRPAPSFIYPDRQP